VTSFVSKACYRISVYEKSTEKLVWLLGFRAFRELLANSIRSFSRHPSVHIKQGAWQGLERGYAAHAMWAAFITTALDNGASLEEVQSAAGHADPSTTKLYDRRGYNPEKSASFFANY
jgi:hypothetical protein